MWNQIISKTLNLKGNFYFVFFLIHVVRYTKTNAKSIVGFINNIY